MGSAAVEPGLDQVLRAMAVKASYTARCCEGAVAPSGSVRSAAAPKNLSIYGKYEMHMVHYCHNYQKLFKQCRTQPRRDGTASGPATRELEAYFPLIRAFRRRASDARSMLEFARCKAIPIEITKSRFGSGLRQGQ